MRRAAWARLVALAAIWLPPSGALSADQARAKPSANSHPRAQAQAELKRLTKQAQQLQSSGKQTEAIAAGEKALVIARELDGNSSETVAIWQDWLGNEYETVGDWPSLKRARAEAFAIRAKLYGPDDWRTVNARLAQDQSLVVSRLDTAQRQELNRGGLLNRNFLRSFQQGQYEKAKPLATEVAAITGKLFGTALPIHAQSLYNLALTEQGLGHVAQAEELFQKSLAIRTTALGLSHPLCAQTEESLGSLEHQRGEYKRAEHLFREALDVRKKVSGDHSAEYAATLESLGSAVQYEGDYARAEHIFQNALQIRRAKFGPRHRITAESLNDLGFLYYRQGEFSKARPLFEEAIEINRASAPSAVLGTNFDNLAKTYLALGDLPRAERLFREALDIRAKISGVQSSPYAISLTNLGVLYLSEADFARAEPLIKRALEIQTKVLGKDHPLLTLHLDHMADTYVGMGDLGRALPIYQRALALRKRTLGEKHPFYAASLDNVAAIDSFVGNTKEAEKLFRSALEIRKAVFGENGPEYAQSLTNLGLLDLAHGNAARAEPLLRQALAIRTQSLGARNTLTAASLNYLGLLNLSVGKSAEGEPLCREALEISLTVLDQALNGLAERQQLTFEASQQAYLTNYLSVTIPAHVSDASVYGYVIKAKGSVTARQSLLRARRHKPELKSLFEELASVNTRLANLALAQPDPSHPDNRLRELDALTQRKEALEENLAAQSGEFANARGASRLSAAQEVQSLQAALPPRTALVDVLEYSHCEPRTAKYHGFAFEQRLVAFVIRREGDVKRIELGPSRKITNAVDNWRKAAVAPDRPRTNGLEFLRELKALLWSKLEPCLQGADTIVLSPDGPLCKFPLGVLPGSKPDSYLIEDRTLVVWPVPRLLALLASPSSQEPKSREPQSLLLVGDVEYGGKPGRADEIASRSAPRLESLRNFGKLDHSAAEVAAIQLSFARQFKSARVDLLLGDDATETAFRRQAPTHRWLHLATHGFYDPPELHARSSTMSISPEGARLVSMAGDQGFFKNGGPGGYHPGLLSGLALAGANCQTVKPGDDDGILTALEVTSLDLSGVELAVLSACETGLGATAGQTTGGEGLLGLQRAFQVAGARSVIAGLWRVPDRETMLLMQRFYQNVWNKKMPKGQALREAQIWMLREAKPPRGLDVADEEPSASKRLPPKYWAGFVLSGDWR